METQEVSINIPMEVKRHSKEISSLQCSVVMISISLLFITIILSTSIIYLSISKK